MISHLLPLVLYVILFSLRVSQTVLRVVLLYCTYSFFNDLSLIYSESHPETGNLGFVLLSVFTLVEFCLFAIIIRMILKRVNLKRIITFSIPIFFIFALVAFYLSLSNSIDSYTIDSISITVEYLILITFCLFYFFEEMSYPNTAFIYSSYKFWVIVGILIYSTGTFFFFMYSSSLDREEWNNWSVINYVFTTVKNLLFTIAVLVAKKENKKNEEFKLHFNDSIEVFKPQ